MKYQDKDKDYKSKHKHNKHKHKRSRSLSSEHRHQRHKKQERKQTQRGRDQDQSRQQQPEQVVKELPCWQPSGILLQFYNSREGISLKFHEPAEARRPMDRWQVYIFKGDEVLNPIVLTNSVYLIGKDEQVCDILCENPTISRQHSVIQFRLISKLNIDNSYNEFIKPYIMDLGSTNGTFLNDEKIESSRYIELLHKDVLRFGLSNRQYVIVKDQSQQLRVEEEQQ